MLAKKASEYGTFVMTGIITTCNWKPNDGWTISFQINKNNESNEDSSIFSGNRLYAKCLIDATGRNSMGLSKRLGR